MEEYTRSLLSSLTFTLVSAAAAVAAAAAASVSHRFASQGFALVTLTAMTLNIIYNINDRLNYSIYMRKSNLNIY